MMRGANMKSILSAAYRSLHLPWMHLTLYNNNNNNNNNSFSVKSLPTEDKNNSEFLFYFQHVTELQPL